MKPLLAAWCLLVASATRTEQLTPTDTVQDIAPNPDTEPCVTRHTPTETPAFFQRAKTAVTNDTKTFLAEVGLLGAFLALFSFTKPTQTDTLPNDQAN